MDIWLTECRKTVPKCHYCLEPIKLGDLMVVGKQWLSSKKGDEVRKWVNQYRWHAQKQLATDTEPKICCWLEEGLRWLAMHPMIETRGRSRLQLTEEQRSERLKLLRQRARLVQKLKTLMEAPLDEKDTDEMIKIGSQIEALKEQIAPIGGVPKSWV